MRARTRSHAVVPVALAAALAVVGCAGPGGGSAASDNKTVTVITHDSFPSEEFAKAASEATGYTVKTVTAGDGGELTNKLVLSQGAPVADVFFGVDSFFASRLAERDLLEPYRATGLPESAEAFRYDDSDAFTPVDQGAVCLNIDPKWFADNGIAEPTGYDDLTRPEYRGLSVVLDPSSSSTGLAFLVGTVSHFGEDGFGDYWQRLAANDVRIENGWTEAYNGQFTQGGGDGSYPIVVSYDTSPAWTVTDDGSATTTKALLDTCTSQVEYAGILKGSEQLDGAKAVIDFMVSREFQDTIATSMYVYPIDDAAEVPEEWTRFAPRPESRNDVPADHVGAKREAWLKEWTQRVGE